MRLWDNQTTHLGGTSLGLHHNGRRPHQELQGFMACIAHKSLEMVHYKDEHSIHIRTLHWNPDKGLQ